MNKKPVVRNQLTKESGKQCPTTDKEVVRNRPADIKVPQSLKDSSGTTL